MTDGQLLYLVFIALYLFDGFGRYPREAWLFTRPWWSRKWLVKRPLDVASNRGEGYGLLPMLGSMFPTGEGWWFAEIGSKNAKPEEGSEKNPTGDGDEEAPETFPQLRWINSPESDSSQARARRPANLSRQKNRLTGTYHNGNIVMPNHTSAMRAFDWISRILPAKDTADLQAEIRKRRDASLSIPRAKVAVKQSRMISQVFRFSEFLLTVYLFLALPFLFHYFQGTTKGLILLLYFLPFSFLMAISWWFVYGRMFPEHSKGRWYKVLPIIFLPYHTLRMPQQLCAELSAGCHPLALAKVLFGPEKFLEFAGDYMRRLRHPLAKNGLPEAWSAHFQACADFLTQKCGIPESDWADQKPECEEPSLSFCPRCHSQYLDAEAKCDTCDDLPTLPF